MGRGVAMEQPAGSPGSWLLRAVSARRTRAFVLAVVVTLAFLILPSWNTWKLYRASERLSSKELRFQRLIGRIVHLDELLSMSARMAAVTGDPMWEERYRLAEPERDAVIEKAIRLAAGSYLAAAERTAATNRNLAAIEKRAFALAREGHRDEAATLLSGSEYERNKRAFADGIGALTSAIDERIRRDLEQSELQVLGAGALTLASAGALLLAWVGVVALIWRHLRARSQAEEQRQYLESQIQHVQKLESLGVLAGGIAHDFNNLLMPILGHADLVLMDLPADSPHRAKLERLRDAGRRLSELTNQLLAYSGKGAFVVRAVHISELVEEMTQLLEISISKKAVLEYDLAEELPAVEGDASQLSQVVMNLVTNASDALNLQGGVVAVRTGLMQADEAYLAECQVFEDCPAGAYVYLEVADAGSGIEPGTQARVFDPFYTTKLRGRGLGLAVILGIVRGHHGAIRLQSAPGRGTTFRILFPCSEAAPEPLPRSPAAVGKWQATGGALVVDDEPDVRELAEIMLKRFGFGVLTAQDGREGVEIFRKHADEIDVVLLDLTMPGMGGEEALREIQRIAPGQKVVLMSGYNEEFAASRFAGQIASFLQKPFLQEELGDTLRSLLQEAD